MGKALCKSIGNHGTDILEKAGCLTAWIRDAMVGKDSLSPFYNEYLMIQISFIPDMAELLQKPAQE